MECMFSSLNCAFTLFESRVTVEVVGLQAYPSCSFIYLQRVLGFSQKIELQYVCVFGTFPAEAAIKWIAIEISF